MRQVDFDVGVVRLDPGTTKSGKGRTFPFDVFPELRTVLEEQRAYTDRIERTTEQVMPWVFHRDGEPIKDFRKAWRTACLGAGLAIPKTDAEGRQILDNKGQPVMVAAKIPHDFRRTAVRRLERAGVIRSVAKELVGHRTDSVYERYDITNEQDLRDGVKKVAQFEEESSRKILPMKKRSTS